MAKNFANNKFIIIIMPLLFFISLEDLNITESFLH
jgi:hypothetical protein